MPSVADLRKSFAKVQRFFDMAMSFGENISYGKNLNPYHFTQNTHVCFTQNTYVLFHAEYAEFAEKEIPIILRILREINILREIKYSA